jgi:hypothetical protein
MQEIEAANQAHVKLMAQYHGRVMVVPNGYAHAVVNAQPCLKLTFDKLVFGDLPAMAFIKSEFMCKLFPWRMQVDYVSGVMHVAEWIHSRELKIKGFVA